jgi:hypothetical protein
VTNTGSRAGTDTDTDTDTDTVQLYVTDPESLGERRTSWGEIER